MSEVRTTISVVNEICAKYWTQQDLKGLQVTCLREKDLNITVAF